MNTIKTAAASVTGARHLRAERNGQDAVAISTAPDLAVVVVADGCSAGAASEVGAQLGAKLFAAAVGERLGAGANVGDPAMWAEARTQVSTQLAALLEHMPGAREDVVCEHLLFTLVAAAVTGAEAAVWALGDGVYAVDGATRVLGPFEDNAPPYLGYDLLGDPRQTHLAVVRDATAIVIGTDGASEIDGGIARFAAAKYLDHPDALRRELALLARPHERIDWTERRVVRTPAMLQDDCAIAVLRREVVS